MKNQALFSSNDKSKKLKCRLLQFLYGASRVNSCKVKKVSCKLYQLKIQTLSIFKSQSDLDLHCLLRPICPNVLKFYPQTCTNIKGKPLQNYCSSFPFSASQQQLTL